MSLSLNIEESLEGLEFLIDDIILVEAATAAALVQGAIEKMRIAGMDDEGIRAVLQADFDSKGRIFGQIENNIKGQVAGLVTAASARAQEEVYLDAGITSNLRRWWTVTLGSGITCPDCPSRDGQVETLQDWQDIGMPGSGWSVCGPHDYCQLILVEVPHGGLVNMTAILEALKG